MKLKVPAAGKGIYRVMIVASWDHWISIDASRPLPTGVHSGAGPFCIHGNALKESYMYAPSNVHDLGVVITEEVQPFHWTVTLEQLDGSILQKTIPRTFCSYFVQKKLPGKKVYRLRIVGNKSGANLHIRGLPPILCPDPQTARKLAGGVTVNAKGEAAMHHIRRVLLRWRDTLQPTDLAVDVTKEDVSEMKRKLAGSELAPWVEYLPDALGKQNLGPRSQTYGRFENENHRHALTALGSAKHPGNWLYGNPAVVRRVLLDILSRHIDDTPLMRCGGDTQPATFASSPDRFLHLPIRSTWYSLGREADWAREILPFKPLLAEAIPTPVIDALKQWGKLWVYARANMHHAEYTNQWFFNIWNMMFFQNFTEDPRIAEIIRRQMRIVPQPGRWGRRNPDPDPWARRSRCGYGLGADSGLTGPGYLAEAFGFDGDYTTTQVKIAARIFAQYPEPAVLEWWKRFYRLKTHLTLSKDGTPPQKIFRDTLSPTDLNFRTREYTHKSDLPADVLDDNTVPYGRLWHGRKSEKTWPCLESESFVRQFDQAFYFINRPAYYAVAYSGANAPAWMTYSLCDIKDGSVETVGFDGCPRKQYGMFGRKVAKPGGVSAVFVRGCGPTLLGGNHDVWYSNTVWARFPKPPVPGRPDAHPHIDAECYATPTFSFDRKTSTAIRNTRFELTPITVIRRMRFLEDRIEVTLSVHRRGGGEITELYETIPYMAEDRNITLYDQALSRATALEIPEPLAYHTKHAKKREDRSPRRAYLDSVFDLPKCKCRAIDISGTTGAGTTILFDQEAALRQVRPVSYRPVASPTGAFLLPLPIPDVGGQTTTHYVIYSHNALTKEERSAKLKSMKYNAPNVADDNAGS